MLRSCCQETSYSPIKPLPQSPLHHFNNEFVARRLQRFLGYASLGRGSAVRDARQRTQEHIMCSASPKRQWVTTQHECNQRQGTAVVQSGWIRRMLFALTKHTSWRSAWPVV